MNFKKLISYIIITVTLASTTFAADGILSVVADWGSNIESAIGTIGYWFMQFINWFMYGVYVIMYLFGVLIFFLSVWFFMFWLPIKLYPTLIQYYNIMKRVFGLI